MDYLQMFPDGVFLVDCEFRPQAGKEGNKPELICMVVQHHPSGTTTRYWADDLNKMKGFPVELTEKALFVAFLASAELDCFLAKGWALPPNVIDLYAEFRCLTNGTRPAYGCGLLGALLYFDLPRIDDALKNQMRALALRGGPWTDTEKAQLLDYCESDVVGLCDLLGATHRLIDWPRALLRGRYICAVSRMQDRGTPIDAEVLQDCVIHWTGIKAQLIADIDAEYGVFDGETFKVARWAAFLERNNIPWPRLDSGALALDDDTFRQQAKAFPLVAPIRELRSALSGMRLSSLTVGDDRRNRCMLSPFASRTGRNQPSSSSFIFGPSVWMRGLIKPPKGFGLAYLDYSQQEFGIAAALSGDTAMQEAYRSGDPYLAFAKQAGAVPANATKKTHIAEREQFKQCVLAVQYGMGPEGLAQRICQPVIRARQLLELHHRTYPKFWKWSDAAVHEADLRGRLWTVFGWELRPSQPFNPRSLRNFPMQANGAEMLRLACIYLTEAGIRVCAPVHDALLIEAALDDLDDVVAQAQKLMAQASADVLNEFELNSDAKIVRYPDRYMDERGEVMWSKVMGLIDCVKPQPLAACLG